MSCRDSRTLLPFLVISLNGPDPPSSVRHLLNQALATYLPEGRVITTETVGDSQRTIEFG